MLNKIEVASQKHFFATFSGLIGNFKASSQIFKISGHRLRTSILGFESNSQSVVRLSRSLSANSAFNFTIFTSNGGIQHGNARQFNIFLLTLHSTNRTCTRTFNFTGTNPRSLILLLLDLELERNAEPDYDCWHCTPWPWPWAPPISSSSSS